MLRSGAKLTLSDDAHGTGDVGFWYDNLPQYLIDNQVTELYYLERALVPSNSRKQETRVVCKKLEECLKHPFWENCVGFVKENY